MTYKSILATPSLGGNARKFSFISSSLANDSGRQPIPQPHFIKRLASLRLCVIAAFFPRSECLILNFSISNKEPFN